MRDFEYIAELVDRVKQADLLAMKVLYNEFAREMLTASHRITQNLSDAEDIIQESFMTSYEKIQNAEKIIAANNNLNIKRFEMINGIFRMDRNSVVLENGKTFNLEKLEITSILTIPKNHNLDFKLENMNLEVEELDGYLKIGSTGGS